MPYYHGSERKKFDGQQRALRELCQHAGMSEAEIHALQRFDLRVFLEERRYREHTQPYAEDRAAATGPTEGYSRYAWIEEISDPALAKAMKSLTQVDLELLTLYVVDGCNQAEAAACLGISQQNVSRRIARLKKYLKNFGQV